MTNERPTFLQYPTNLATSIGESITRGDSMDGYYGHWILISIYEPEKTQANFTAEQGLGVLGRAGAALGTPFFLDLLGLPGGFNAFTSTITVGTLSFFNLDEQQRNVATSGYDGTNIPGDLNSATRSRLTEARNKERIPEARAKLGLGLKFRKSPVRIALPMPKQIKSNYGFEYSETDFSGMNTINSAIAIGKKITDKSPKDDFEKLISSPDLQGLLSFAETIPAAAVDEGFKILGLDPNLLDYTRAGRNQTKIPYSEKLFKSVKRRSFDLEYSLLPKNETEVLRIYEIIKTLKMHSHPKKINNSYYYGTPSEFVVDFNYLGSTNNFLPKYGRLAIESIDVDYGSSQGFSTLRPTSNLFGIPIPSFIPSGFSGSGSMVSPTEINIKISFSELELLTKERIEEGY